MKTYEILEVVETVYGYEVEAKSEQDALDKINNSFGGETEDIIRVPERDDVVSRDYQCEGEIK